MAQIHRILGGVAGLGGTLGARLALDEAGRDRLKQPSVLYGLGTGVGAAALWGVDSTGTFDLDSNLVQGTSDFFAAHAATAGPAGAASALLPKQAGSTNGSSQQLADFFEDSAGGASQAMSGSVGATDYADAN